MKTFSWFIGVGALLLCVPAAALSATMSTRCVVGNQDCFQLRVGSGKLSAASRMALVNDRLAALLGTAKPGDVHVETTEGGDSTLLVGRALVVTCTRADVAATGAASTKQLAECWAENLVRALEPASNTSSSSDEEDGPIAVRRSR